MAESQDLKQKLDKIISLIESSKVLTKSEKNKYIKILFYIEEAAVDELINMFEREESKLKAVKDYIEDKKSQIYQNQLEKSENLVHGTKKKINEKAEKESGNKDEKTMAGLEDLLK